ncbi:DUF2513 domain-containing protein [Sphingobacterium sp. HJSM2_6]|uniref:DUF2513 domain-containing protein n=1 Tax=Sphingobacterium sp. HJSM2_6 TaxID=3366264 RepID=UPI003BDA4465
MKLDIELCRIILQKIENESDINGLQIFPHINGYNDDFVFYQIKKMKEAGYIDYDIYGKSNKYEYFTTEITYYGHEFLRQMLDDTIWTKTKDLAKSSGMSLTFETVKAIIPIAIQYLLKSIKGE